MEITADDLTTHFIYVEGRSGMEENGDDDNRVTWKLNFRSSITTCSRSVHHKHFAHLVSNSEAISDVFIFNAQRKHPKQELLNKSLTTLNPSYILLLAAAAQKDDKLLLLMVLSENKMFLYEKVLSQLKAESSSVIHRSLSTALKSWEFNDDSSSYIVNIKTVSSWCIKRTGKTNLYKELKNSLSVLGIECDEANTSINKVIMARKNTKPLQVIVNSNGELGTNNTCHQDSISKAKGKLI